MKIKRCSLLLVCVVPWLYAITQVTGYHYQATIGSIKEFGFYNIVLTPAINSHLKIDYSDLRIVNDSGKWVPHVLRMPNGERVIEEVIWDLPMTKQENAKNFTELLVKTKTDKISNLLLRLRNTDAERYCTLTGSDDSKNWFIINDSILVKPEKSSDHNSAVFMINFPAVNYQFYKLTIHNNGKAPFNIISIGNKALAEGPGIVPFHEPVENPITAVSQKDSGNFSFIKIDQHSAYHFDRISLKINGVKYFNRRVDLYIPASPVHSFSNPGQLIESFSVSNNSTLQFKLNTINAAVFYLVIHNEDNLPLRVEQVKTFNNYYVVTAYLEKDNLYKLIMDNAAATAPKYDIKLLDITNVRSLPSSAIDKIIAIPTVSTVPVAAGNNKWLIWLTIGIATLVLGFFTYKLVNEMNNKKT